MTSQIIRKFAASGASGRMRPLNAIAMAPLALVTACGGGGSALNSTPPPPSYTTLVNASASTPLATQAATYEYSRSFDISHPTLTAQATNVTVSYDPATQTYTVSGTPVIGSTTRVEQSFGPANAVAGSPGSYNKTMTTISRTDVSSLTIGSSPQLTYVSFGAWEVGVTTGTDQRFDTVYFSYGIPTQLTDMPKTGSASYTLGIIGQASSFVSGSGSLTANFAASTVDVSLSLQGAPERPLTQQAPFATLTGSGTIGSANNLPGFTSSLTGDGYTGSINGLFYGPQAAEVGGAFSVTNDGRGYGPVAGAVSGKKN